MSTALDTLTTDRLIIRPLTLDDLDPVHAIMNAGFGAVPRAEREAWLQWTARNYAALARLAQPPFGDRGIVLRATGALIGSVGLVPSYGPFDKLPYFRTRACVPPSGLFTPEIGLFWVLDARHRGQGYATEAARAVIDAMFSTQGLKRIVAMSDYENVASIAVMQRLGMTVERNPDPNPEWFQVVGILENPAVDRSHP
jgi:RimJ/RimL family protein N-acetyltransferase